MSSAQRNPADERQVKVRLTDQGRALRAQTRTLADALYGKSGMTLDETAALTTGSRPCATPSAARSRADQAARPSYSDQQWSMTR